MNPKDLRTGLVLRVITAHGLGAPRGTVATVLTVETSPSGDWFCTVAYHNKRAPKHGTRLYRSHLWESDLGRFEIVTDEKTGPSIRSRKHDQERPTRIQLQLPFVGDDGGGEWIG